MNTGRINYLLWVMISQHWSTGFMTSLETHMLQHIPIHLCNKGISRPLFQAVGTRKWKKKQEKTKKNMTRHPRRRSKGDGAQIIMCHPKIQYIVSQQARVHTCCNHIFRFSIQMSTRLQKHVCISFKKVTALCKEQLSLLTMH